MMQRVISEIVTKIGPAPTNTDHHSLAMLANESDEEFDGWRVLAFGAPREMEKTDIGIWGATGEWCKTLAFDGAEDDGWSR
jgi:hypothetical protein